MSAMDPRIAEALELALSRGEIGVQVAAYQGGELIVDAWTGTADTRDGRPVDGDTIFPSFSAAKGATATAVHLQAERGLLDYDAPIASYWPEFGVAGKADATVAHALSHRLGTPQMPQDVTPERLDDWDWIVSRIAEVEPLEPPGTVNRYLPYTFGWILGELVRRTDPQQRPFGQFVQDELCAPLGIDSLWLGVPERELARGARLEQGPSATPSPARAALRGQGVPPAVELVPDVYNRDDVRRACIPATGIVANARSLARLFAMLANGGEGLLSPERVRGLTRRRDDYEVADLTNAAFMPVGAMGFWLSDASVGAGPGILCSVGAGGAVSWADLETGLAVSICHNRMFSGIPKDAHPLAPLADAVRAVARD